MPELTVCRKNPSAPPMVCMYCGARATYVKEWQETNHPPSKSSGGGGANLSAPVTGDDPISAFIAVLMLPLVLWELLKELVTGIGAMIRYFTTPRPAPAPVPKPKDLPTTRVAVTTCDRHRRFRDRFVWAGVAGALALVGLWVWGVLETRRVMGTENVGLAVTLIITAVFATVLIPLTLSAWYAFGGPVIVDRVTEDTVVLDRIRQPYFDATGLAPNGDTSAAA